MVSGKGLSQEVKVSRAIARCILTGTASVVATYLIWKVVDTISMEVPMMFGSTCLLVGLIAVLSTVMAIYKLNNHKPMIRLAPTPAKSTLQKPTKVESFSEDIFMAVSVDKSEGAWYQRN